MRPALVIAAGLGLAALALAARQAQAAQSGQGGASDVPLFGDIVIGGDDFGIGEWFNPTIEATYGNDMREDQNLAAFLAVIRYSEGATYNTLYGGGTFDSYADHPRQYLTYYIKGKPVTSSAAGAYQFLARTWDGVKTKLGLPDFSPDNQDRAAIELIRQRGALADVKAGRFDIAIEKCRKEWASLPGADYGQWEKSLAELRAAYESAGGAYA